MERKMFDTPVLPRLATILAEVKFGDLVVPKFQRPFVWDGERRLRLFDSIAQGMPIGSLLVWRTSKRDLATYDQLGGVRLEQGGAKGEKVSYLIDGHQRLATLFGALYPGERETQEEEQDVRWPLYYELGAVRPSFRLPLRRGKVPDHWLRLNILLDGDALFDVTQHLRKTDRRHLAKEAENLANVLRDYIIPIVPMVTDDLDTVTDAFVRINSQGKTMTEAHMLRALTYLKPTDTERSFNGIRERLEPLGWANIDDQVFVNILKVLLGLEVYSARVETIHAKLREDPSLLEKLPDAVEEAVTALSVQGVRGFSALPYAYQLVAFAAVAYQCPGRLSEPAIRNRLERWLWITTYTEHFSGLSGAGIRTTIDDLMQDPEGAKESITIHDDSIESLKELRMAAVRTQAFLLFLAQLPSDPENRRRRQELLASAASQSTQTIFQKQPRNDPANCIIAEPGEARRIRDYFGKLAARKRSGEIESSNEAAREADQDILRLLDELGIPAEALGKLPDEKAFLAERRRWLFQQEEAFLQKLGLRVRENAH